MSSSFCASCGHHFEADDAFCRECGHPRGAEVPAPQAGAPDGTAPVAPEPPAGAAGAGRTNRNLLIAAAAILAVLAVGVAVLVLVRHGSDDAASSGGEVFLVAEDDPGPDPYATDLTVATPSTTAPPSTTAATTTQAGSGLAVATRSGATPGLYGGTRDAGRCDPAQLVAFLEANPAKAEAWAEALDADPTLRWSGGQQLLVDQIGRYVDELTPVTLVRDTRVTNHGYRNGRPTSIQAVLQAGTAVLVDERGVPRVKCGCGNPLTVPTAVQGTITYTGTPWAGWSPANVTVVVQSTVVVQQFVLVNLSGPGYIARPAGTDGGEDTEASPPSTTTTTAPPPTSAPSTTRAPTTTAVPAGDFCTIAEGWVPEFRNFVLAGLGTDTFPDATKVIAGAEQLEAVAPTPEVKADLGLLLDFLRSPSAEGASIELAALRAYLIDTCHINVDG